MSANQPGSWLDGFSSISAFLLLATTTALGAPTHSWEKVELTLQASTENPRSTTNTVRVAGIVLKWVRGDKEANYRRIEPLVREAAARGAHIVCTTECFLDGYANPFADATLQATFTRPDNSRVSFWGFHDGDGHGGQDSVLHLKATS